MALSRAIRVRASILALVAAPLSCGGNSESEPGAGGAGGTGGVGGGAAAGGSGGAPSDASSPWDAAPASPAGADALCKEVCKIPWSLKCSWFHSGGVCWQECYADVITCVAAKQHAECVLNSGAPTCTKDFVTSPNCAAQLEAMKGCGVSNFDAAPPPPCTPGDFGTCECGQQYGTKSCKADGTWTPCSCE